jgi:hypothetical protein
MTVGSWREAFASGSRPMIDMPPTVSAWRVALEARGLGSASQ